MTEIEEKIGYTFHDPALLEHYQKQAKLRGQIFSTENTVKAVENMLSAL